MDFNLSTFARTALWKWGQVMHNQRIKHRQKEDVKNLSSVSVSNEITSIIISLYCTKALLYWVPSTFRGLLRDLRDPHLCKQYNVSQTEHEKYRHAFLSAALGKRHREMKRLYQGRCGRPGSRTH